MPKAIVVSQKFRTAQRTVTTTHRTRLQWTRKIYCLLNNCWSFKSLLFTTWLQQIHGERTADFETFNSFMTATWLVSCAGCWYCNKLTFRKSIWLYTELAKPNHETNYMYFYLKLLNLEECMDRYRETHCTAYT